MKMPEARPRRDHRREFTDRKTVFGDASRSKTHHPRNDRRCSDLPLHLDLIIICDGSGRSPSLRFEVMSRLPDILGRSGGRRVQNNRFFTMIRGKLYQLCIDTGILLQSGEH